MTTEQKKIRIEKLGYKVTEIKRFSKVRPQCVLEKDGHIKVYSSIGKAHRELFHY